MFFVYGKQVIKWFCRILFLVCCSVDLGWVKYYTTKNHLLLMYLVFFYQQRKWQLIFLWFSWREDDYQSETDRFVVRSTSEWERVRFSCKMKPLQFWNVSREVLRLHFMLWLLAVSIQLPTVSCLFFVIITDCTRHEL